MFWLGRLLARAVNRVLGRGLPYRPSEIGPSPHVPPATGNRIVVTSVTFRQSALRRTGVGEHLFRLIRLGAAQVAVYCSGELIGSLPAPLAPAFAAAVERVERDGHALYVHGVIEPSPGRMLLLAFIDCPPAETVGRRVTS